MTTEIKESKQSVDFSNYNPYYKDVSEYIKACNKARLMYKENRDLEPFYTAIDILVNTTAPYIRGKIEVLDKDGKKEKKPLIEVLDEIGEFIPQYRILRKRVTGVNVANSSKSAFVERENTILTQLSKIQRHIIKDLSYFKILPRVSIEYEEEEEDGLAYA
jgi:hypothetical protein